MKDNVIQSEEYKGYDIEIVIDSDPQNPRTEWDNLGTMVCWHRRYHLGDMSGKRPLSDDYQGPATLFAEIANVDTDSNYLTALYENQGEQALTEYLHKKALEKAVILPLYLYDHSGITMSTGRFSDPWDSGQVGYIYLTFADAKKEYGLKNLTKKRIKLINDCLQSEVETYDDFLTGAVYGFDTGNGSCYGFYGDDGRKEAVEQAKASIDGHIKDLDQKQGTIIRTYPINT